MCEWGLDAMDGETWDNRAYRLGRQLGYPDCCIYAFCTEDYVTRPTRKFDGTGYVPCEECNKKTEGELFSEISKNRKCDTIFPQPPWGVDTITCVQP